MRSSGACLIMFDTIPASTFVLPVPGGPWMRVSLERRASPIASRWLALYYSIPMLCTRGICSLMKLLAWPDQSCFSIIYRLTVFDSPELSEALWINLSWLLMFESSNFTRKESLSDSDAICLSSGTFYRSEAFRGLRISIYTTPCFSDESGMCLMDLILPRAE